MGGTNHLVIFAEKDTEVGGINLEGYAKVKHEGKTYSCHRIVYELCFGEIGSNFEIDHIDGNKLNNRSDNLRKVSKEVNMRNTTKQISNTSGVTGVYYRITRHKDVEYPCWMAQWVDLDRVRHTKTFSVNKFGYKESFDMAVKFRETMICKLNTLGANYSERHGI